MVLDKVFETKRTYTEGFKENMKIEFDDFTINSSVLFYFYKIFNIVNILYSKEKEMLKLSTLFCGVLATGLYANQITIRVTVVAHANTQMKTTQVTDSSIRQDIYLETNYQGLTIALSDSSYGTSTLMNGNPIGTIPMNFSDETYTKLTRVGELIISQKENQGSLGIIISVK